MLIAFIIGIPIPLAALSAASLLLFTRRIKPDRVFREIDWSLLIFFTGLFVITFSLNKLISPIQFVPINKNLNFPGMINLTFVSTILSNLISNVPAVLILSPSVKHFSDTHLAWLIISMATTFAGNLTLLGSVANMIVAESSIKKGIKLEFVEYLKTGIPLTILSLLIGIFWFAFIG